MEEADDEGVWIVCQTEGAEEMGSLGWAGAVEGAAEMEGDEDEEEGGGDREEEGGVAECS